MWDICEKTDKESQQTQGWGHIIFIFASYGILLKLLYFRIAYLPHLNKVVMISAQPISPSNYKD